MALPEINKIKDSANNKYTVLVNAVVVKDGKILLSQRSWEDEHGAGKWTIPGGKLEATGVVYIMYPYTGQLY